MQLGAEVYYYVKINAPITYLSLNRLQIIIVGRETNTQTLVENDSL